LRDLRGLVQTLLQHVEGVQAHLPSAAQLARIRTEWDAAPLDQLTLWQERVTACLQSLTLEQAESGKHAVTQQASAGTAPVSPAMDAVTGLPTRKIAESAIQTALSGSKPVYVALFYVHRMGLTNARFGEAIGNQVMQFCGQHIATHLIRSNDLLSRWRGASLLAVLERDGTEQAVTAEVQRIVSAPLSRFFETTSRTVYLPMKMSAEVIATTGKTWTEIEERIETFILHAAHATE
jgi:GGDEF domain-containing protein